MAFKFSEMITLVVVQCANCSIPFAIPEQMEQKRREDHAGFHCPSGHSNIFPAKSDLEITRASLEKERREAASLRERAIVAERAQAKAEAAINRHKKRAAAGLCICCNRTVFKLAAHMKAKHPQFMALQGLGDRKQLAEKSQ